MRGRELVDNLAAALAINECMCRQEPLRLAVQPDQGTGQTRQAGYSSDCLTRRCVQLTRLWASATFVP